VVRGIEALQRVDAVDAPAEKHRDLAGRAQVLGHRDLAERTADAEHVVGQGTRDPLGGAQQEAPRAAGGHEGQGVEVIDAHRHAGEERRDHAQEAALGSMRVDDVRLPPAQLASEADKREEIRQRRDPARHRYRRRLHPRGGREPREQLTG
jgi:hypothetical protein